MLRVALKMLMGDRAKYLGLLFGITFTSFLVTFAASYFCGFMTRGFALIAENPRADVWVMDPAVASVEQSINIAVSALDRVRSVEGVASAVPLALGVADARFANGRVQPFQVIGVDDATLSRVPALDDGASLSVLRALMQRSSMREAPKTSSRHRSWRPINGRLSRTSMRRRGRSPLVTNSW
jgi:putative ABC transport system permease protein